MPPVELLVSACVLAFAVLFALLYRPRPTAQAAPTPAAASPPAAIAPAPAPTVVYAPPSAVSPVQAFSQMGEQYVNAEFSRALGMFQAQKVAAELSEALATITRPLPPKS